MRDERAFLADMLFAARAVVRFIGDRTEQEILRRNVVVHVYWGVNLAIVWSTATTDMAALILALEKHLGPQPGSAGEGA